MGAISRLLIRGAPNCDPRGSVHVNQVPYHWYNGPESIGYTHVPDAPKDSDTQGEGKSPGMRWPWQHFFSSRAPSAYCNAGFPYRHELPTRIIRKGEIGPLNASGVAYLAYYEQNNRHAWPGGGVIEYGQSVPLALTARRLA